LNLFGNTYFFPFFLKATRLPSGAPLPHDLFDFTETELSINPALNEKLVPEWKRSTSSSSSGGAAAAAPAAMTSSKRAEAK
jgi:hypothetical protein